MGQGYDAKNSKLTATPFESSLLNEETVRAEG